MPKTDRTLLLLAQAESESSGFTKKIRHSFERSKIIADMLGERGLELCEEAERRAGLIRIMIVKGKFFDPAPEPFMQEWNEFLASCDVGANQEES